MDQITRSTIVLLLLGLIACNKAPLPAGHKPDTFESLRQGIRLLEGGQAQEAVAAFNQAIEDNPRSVKAFCNRGHAWFDLGKYETAISDYGVAIELDPICAEAYAYRGVAWAKRSEGRDLEKAMADCNEAIRLNPNYADGYHNRYVVWAKLGRNEKAMADFEKAAVLRAEKAE